jgi:D-aminoacyl-tRNA deacylase
VRAVVQRVTRAQVSVGGVPVGTIGKGLCVLVGVGDDDSNKDALDLADKIVGLRIFEDADGKMNRSVEEERGDLLMISQFTLFGDARKGRRPGFSKAMAPGPALGLFEECVRACQSRITRVERGKFGADMLVEIMNDGPVTILLDTKRLF